MFKKLALFCVALLTFGHTASAHPPVHHGFHGAGVYGGYAGGVSLGAYHVGAPQSYGFAPQVYGYGPAYVVPVYYRVPIYVVRPKIQTIAAPACGCAAGPSAVVTP